MQICASSGKFTGRIDTDALRQPNQADQLPLGTHGPATHACA